MSYKEKNCNELYFNIKFECFLTSKKKKFNINIGIAFNINRIFEKKCIKFLIIVKKLQMKNIIVKNKRKNY